MELRRSRFRELLTLGLLLSITSYLVADYFQNKEGMEQSQSAAISTKTKEFLAKGEAEWQKLIKEELQIVDERLGGVIPVLTEKGEISNYLGPKSDVPLWAVEELGKSSSFRANKAGMNQTVRVVRGHCQFAEGPNTCSIEAVQEYVYQKFLQWASAHNYKLVSFVAYKTTRPLPDGALTHESRLFIGAFLAPMEPAKK